MQRNNLVQHLSDTLLQTLTDMSARIDDLQSQIDELVRGDRVRSDSGPWFDRREAASFLRCHPSTIDEMAASGRLPKHLLGSKPLYHIDDLSALVKPALVAVVDDEAA